MFYEPILALILLLLLLSLTQSVNQSVNDQSVSEELCYTRWRFAHLINLTKHKWIKSSSEFSWFLTITVSNTLSITDKH